MKAEEIELDAIPGLPSDLPPGEQIVWQGRPQWKALAFHAFKLRWIATYFAALLLIRVASLVMGGGDVVVPVIIMAAVFGLGLGLCALLAWLQARSAIYTLTNRRVVMHLGVACPVTWNLPFERIEAADLTVRDDGDGDVVLRLAPPDRVAWVHLWPHARRGRRLVANPTLRAIAEPRRIAALLESAVRSWADEQEVDLGLFVDSTIGADDEAPGTDRSPLVQPQLAPGVNR